MSQGAGREERGGLVMRGQRESRAEEREERRVLEASSGHRRANCSEEGRSERAAEERDVGESDLRLRLVMIGREGDGGVGGARIGREKEMKK